MDIVRVLAFALVAVMLLAVVREQRPEIAVALSVAAVTCMFVFVAERVAVVVSVIRDLASTAGVSQVYLSTVFKIIGVAYIAEFGSEICRDARESAVAAKVELAGKVLILVLAVPIIQGILETVVRMLS